MANESHLLGDESYPQGLGSATEFFMAAPVIIGYVTRPNYVIALANPGLLEVWGRGPEVVGLPLTDAIPELRGQGFTDVLDEVCLTGIPFYAYAYPIRLNRTGVEDTYYFDFIYKAYYGNGKNKPATGVISVGHDVTAQVKARILAEEAEARLQTKVKERTADLQRVIAELEAANSNLQRFASAASHDLKAPIRKIQLFAQTLYDRLYDSLPQQDRHYFSRILAAGKQMNTLIEDLLAYAYVTTASSVFEWVDLNSILQLVIEDLELEIEQKSAHISVGNLPTVCGNGRQFQQLFQNLIANGLKYAHPERPPRIDVTCSVTDRAQLTAELPFNIAGSYEFYWLRIADNGIGFDQADADRIFQVFVRLHNNTIYTGSGVGLSIVHKVVENHNGHVYATSIKGEGSVFHLIFPTTTAGCEDKT